MGQEGTHYLPTKFNVAGGKVNQFIESLKEQYQNMGWNSHPTSGIITTAEANGLDLNLFDNYGQMIARDKTTHATIYVDADARHMKKKPKFITASRTHSPRQGLQKSSPRAPRIT